MILPTIPTTDLFWSLKLNASLREVYGRMSERDDAECWSAYELNVAAGKPEAYFLSLQEAVELLPRTDRIMDGIESDERIRVACETEGLLLGGLARGAMAAHLELLALTIEGFVRMHQRGLSYPQATPFDLAAVPA